MKIIGTAGVGGHYIAEVSHIELERAFEKGYGLMRDLRVGSELDLASIPDQRKRIEEATRTMQSAAEAFQKALPAMTQMALVVAKGDGR